MNIKENIERQDIIGEAKTGSYQPIRFTRVKYKGSNATYIDIRMYQRGYDDEGEEIYFPTKKGFHFPEAEFKKVVKSWTILPESYIHPEVMDKSFELLAKRQFESAVLQAFKCVEIAIREKAGLSKDDFGIKLIRKAFDVNKGSLTRLDLPTGEREAMAHYVAGAHGLYKNPCSHRNIKMEFLEAFERIVIASNILKIVEDAQVNTVTEKS